VPSRASGCCLTSVVVSYQFECWDGFITVDEQTGWEGHPPWRLHSRPVHHAPNVLATLLENETGDLLVMWVGLLSTGEWTVVVFVNFCLISPLRFRCSDATVDSYF